ncbi:hypothetical protein FHG87_010219 [Trinorchestia longiramus]|nr:hypothetical protein FHG87_010219 [Trinorchestia longiramus]
MGESGCGKALQAEGLGSRSTLVPGEHGVQGNPLVDMNKVFLPPLHIKLGLMKHFVKAIDRNCAASQHLYILFPALSSVKLKESIFVGPQIREVLKDKDFEELFTLKELRTWEAFKSVCHGFLANTRGPDYQECIEELLQSDEDLGYRMSLKIHFLHSHFNFFPRSTRSPDLNPLNFSIWSILETRVLATPHTSLESLKAKLQREWKAIPQEQIRAACDTFVNRLEALVRNNGGYIE